MKKIATVDAPAAIGPYSQGMVFGNLVFSSGQIPVVPATGEIAGTTIEEQAEQSCKNVAAVLAAGGTSMENVIKTKFELADYVIKDGGNCFVNIDNEYIKNNLPKEAVTYGTCDEADYKAEVINVSKSGTAFSVRFPDGEIVELQSILIGAHNVVNLCGAVAMAHFMGVSPAEIKAQMPKITAVPHRLQLLEKGPYTIIDDAFNSNPAGSAAALDTLALFEDFKILVTPGMVELGAKEEECNREFGRHAAKVCDYVVLVGKKQTEPIFNGLKDEGYPDEKIYVADSFNEGIQAAYNVTADRRKIILLENDLPDNY